MGIVRTINTYRHFYNESLPPKPKWGTKDIPDLTGKVMLVTGGNAGIGYEIVKGVLEKNAKVARHDVPAYVAQTLDQEFASILHEL